MTKTDLYNTIIDYSNCIISGKIKACKKHKWACKRLLNDLEKSGQGDSAYFFDTDELFKFYTWAKMFKHRVGILANTPIELTPFQLFVCGNIFCWKSKDTGYRRFRKVYIQLARKNAKSQLLACIATYECFLSDEQAEVYITGWNRKGSDVVYREILFQLKTASMLKGKYTTSYGKITHTKSGSFIEPLSREAKNTDSANNPSLAIVDEYWQHHTSEIYDSLLSGMVARVQPLIIIITTAGYDLSRPCYKEYEYVSRILDPNFKDITNDEYFAIVCELESDDDIKDESNWIKANPIVATYENGLKFLRGELKAALDAPEKLKVLLTKNMNRWVNMKDNGYMDMKKWSEAEEEFSLDTFAGSTCVLGVDLSTKLDLTSIAFEFCTDGIFYTYQHSFIPEETYKRRLNEGKYPFDLWAEQGFLTVIDGSVIDYSMVKDYIHSVESEFNIVILEICYDPYNASQFIQDLEFEGYICMEVRQGMLSLNEPTKDYRDKVYEGKMKHTRDGLYTWAMGNAISTKGKQECIMLDKAKSSEKIDPAAAAMNAHYRGMKILNTDNNVFYSPDIN